MRSYLRAREPWGLAATTLLLMSVCHSTEAFSSVVPGRSNRATAIAAPAKTPIRFHVSNSQLSSLWAIDNDVNEHEILDAQVVDNKVNGVKRHNPAPALVSLMKKTDWNAAASMKSHGMLVAVAMAFALMVSPLPSDAAMSGGRLGGSYASPSMRRSAPARSYSSSPSRSSYSSGYARGFGAGVGAGALSAPRVSFGFSPFYNPFYSPYGYYGGGPGVISYSRGPGLLPLLIVGGLVWTAFNAVQERTEDFLETSDLGSMFESSALGSGVSVLKLSVAMDVSDRDSPNSILSVLNNLSNTARTNSRVGIQNLTSQVALELLRRKATIVSGSSEYKHFRDRSKAYREYNNLSVKERSKFESETASNYGGVDYTFGKRAAPSATATSPKATMAVVTILLTIDGDSTKIPTIQSVGDVETALRKIATDAKVDDCLQSTEILWTPEDRSETLTLRDVVADYPDLRTV